MENISSLETFDNLVAAGIPEGQARAQVYAINNSFEHLATKNDLALMEANLKHFFTWEIIVVFIAVMAIPAISDRLTNVFRKK